jgi:tricorn protease
MENRMLSIWLYSLSKNKSYQVTDEFTSNYSPTFDPKGRYLYFLSNRDFNLTFSEWEFNYVYTKPTRIYMVALKSDFPLPFEPKSDEEGQKENHPIQKLSNPDDEIEIHGLESRIKVLPLPAGRYQNLQANENGVFYLKEENDQWNLAFYNIQDEKEIAVLSGVNNFVLSANGNKILYSSRGQYGIIDAGKNAEKDRGTLDLSGMMMKIDPKKEWHQIFVDGWRLIRDWFYDPNLHGVDWQKMRKKYEPLVEYVAHRADLDYIFGELGGELSSGHVYVNSGDQPRVERHDNGLLGCEVSPDPSGYYKITKIFPGENWHENFRSPLTEPGLHVKEGDFILAIDNQPVTTKENFYKYLENKGGHMVTLLINSRPTNTGAREIRIKTIKSETNLRYLDWVYSRQKLVEKLSGGKIGYIHIPNTAVEGNRELFKHFYPQTKKEALIIDDRYNGGGFIPDRMIELLDRPLLNYWMRRGVKPTRTPGFTHTGPKACLINGYSSSGGDAFPYYFKKRGLGLLIGTRTWGGLIGLSGNPNFVDNGSISIPTFRFLDTDGHWVIENEGVSPDIEVVDRPDLVVKGKDPTLEKAVEVLLKELKQHPVKKVVVPPPPVETIEEFLKKVQ